MTNKEIVLNELNKNNGIIYAKQIFELGVNNKTLQRLKEEGVIERVENGLYINPDIMEDEYLLAQYRCRKGIYSHETALYFHDLSDRIPIQLTMTIPSGYNTRLLKEKERYKFFYVSIIKYKIGEIVMETNYGNKVKVYDKERTICDCINKKEMLDKDIVISAIKKYVKEKGSDFSKLLNYAELFKIKKIVKEYLEVLY